MTELTLPAYTCRTTISRRHAAAGRRGNGSILGNVINSATLAFDRGNTVTFAGLISGSGNLTQIGSDTAILTADNTYTGGTIVDAGSSLCRGWEPHEFT